MAKGGLRSTKTLNKNRIMLENENTNKPQKPQLNIGAVMCGSCKHWQNNGRGNIGKCMISKIRHPMMHSGCGLYTREDFGCKLFQNRT